MARLSLEEAKDVFQVSGWSEDYFEISSKGTLAVLPEGPDGPRVDLDEVAAHLREQDVGMPVVLRFPQLLTHRVTRLNNAFLSAMREHGCQDVRYRGVFPIKVNQRKELVQALAKAGRKFDYGLEVGSKAELLAALAMDPNKRSLLVVNGFKDKPFLEAACQAAHLKETVVIVLDELGELEHLLPILDKAPVRPLLGIRLKLRSKAPGKWALSGGERSKFGLTIPEVLDAVKRLKAAGHIDRLGMLHFHIGSQISDIRRIVQGVREAARIHTELVKMGVPLQYLDVGGGMAVDYDGSGSSGSNSANYTMEEYANSIVATLKDACDDAEVPMPGIINESGRAVVAHHAVLLMDVVRRVPGLELDPDTSEYDDDPTPLANLRETFLNLRAKNVFESFHDAVQHREDLQNLFDLGHLNIEQLGRMEVLFRATVAKVREILEKEDETDAEEYEHAGLVESRKLVCNFSLFQSLPDVWGVKQQFPIVPIHRLRERPTDVATIADITCDSDGEIRRFTDTEGSRQAIPVHHLRPGKPYVLAAALVGAYQDTLGDYHNLFGETDEAWITADEEGWKLAQTVIGSRVSDMLAWVRYEAADVRKRLRGRIQRLQTAGELTPEQADEMVARFNNLLVSRTYLESSD